PHLYLHPFPTRRSSDLSKNSIRSWIDRKRLEPDRKSVEVARRAGVINSSSVSDLSKCKFLGISQRLHLLQQRHNQQFAVRQISSDRKSTRLNSSHVKIS